MGDNYSEGGSDAAPPSDEALFKSLRSEEVSAYHAVTKAFMMLAGPALPDSLAQLLTEVKDTLHVSDSRHTAEEAAALLSPDVLAVIAARPRLAVAPFAAAPRKRPRNDATDSSSEDDGKRPLRPHSSKKAKKIHTPSAFHGAASSHPSTAEPARTDSRASLSSHTSVSALTQRAATLRADIASLTQQLQAAGTDTERETLRASLAQHNTFLEALLRRLDAAGRPPVSDP